MSLIVEDGSMPEGANSYASLADADAYLVPRGLWPVTPLVGTDDGTETPDAAMVGRKESALMRGTDYLNSLRWKGNPVNWDRAMAWPRAGVPLPAGTGNIPEDKVPSAVAYACMEMAAVIFGGGNPLEVVERGGMITSESHTKTEGNVDVIGGDAASDSYAYAATAPLETYYPQLRMVEPYLAHVPGKASGLRIKEVGRG